MTVDLHNEPRSSATPASTPVVDGRHARSERILTVCQPLRESQPATRALRRQLLAKREPLYRQSADLEIDAENKSSDEVAQEVAKSIEARS